MEWAMSTTQEKAGGLGVTQSPEKAAKPPPIIPLPPGGGKGVGQVLRNLPKVDNTDGWGDAQRSPPPPEQAAKPQKK